MMYDSSTAILEYQWIRRDIWQSVVKGHRPKNWVCMKNVFIYNC